MRTIKESLKIAIVSLFMLFFIGVTYAWIEPGAAPPTPNVSAPITASSTPQNKIGDLRIGVAAAPTATLDVGGNRGGGDQRNFRVTYPPGGGLANTELAGLAHLGTELGIGWTALYARQGAASYAGVFNGNVLVTNNTTINGSANVCKKVSYGQTGSMGCGANYYIVGAMDTGGNMGNPASPPTDGFLLCCKNAD